MCDLLVVDPDRGVMLNDGKSRFSKNGQPIGHFLGASTFNEYTVVHAGCVANINPAAPLDKACLLSCGFCTGYGATVNVAKPKLGSTVAIFGLGAVGLAAAEGARVSGASKIIGVDLNSGRLEKAKKFGVNEFVNPKDHDRPVQEGWGVAVLVGLPNRDDAFKTHPFNVLQGRTLKGTFYGNFKARSDLPSVMEKYMKGELDLDKFITHSVPFSEINKAFDYMMKGECIRCIIRMQD